jgi:hypothetical protein
MWHSAHIQPSCQSQDDCRLRIDGLSLTVSTIEAALDSYLVLFDEFHLASHHEWFYIAWERFVCVLTHIEG